MSGPSLHSNVANLATDALLKSKEPLTKELEAVTAALQAPKALEIQKLIDRQNVLQIEIQDVDRALAEINRAKDNPVREGGGCTG